MSTLPRILVFKSLWITSSPRKEIVLPGAMPAPLKLVMGRLGVAHEASKVTAPMIIEHL